MSICLQTNDDDDESYWLVEDIPHFQNLDPREGVLIYVMSI